MARIEAGGNVKPETLTAAKILLDSIRNLDRALGVDPIYAIVNSFRRLMVMVEATSKPEQPGVTQQQAESIIDEMDKVKATARKHMKMLSNARIQFSRDRYDRVYEIAISFFESASPQHPILLQHKLEQREKAYLDSVLGTKAPTKTYPAHKIKRVERLRAAHYEKMHNPRALARISEAEYNPVKRGSLEARLEELNAQRSRQADHQLDSGKFKRIEKSQILRIVNSLHTMMFRIYLITDMLPSEQRLDFDERIGTIRTRIDSDDVKHNLAVLREIMRELKSLQHEALECSKQTGVPTKMHKPGSKQVTATHQRYLNGHGPKHGAKDESEPSGSERRARKINRHPTNHVGHAHTTNNGGAQTTIFSPFVTVLVPNNPNLGSTFSGSTVFIPKRR